METRAGKSLGFAEKITYGFGAVAKDMVYMLSASYILYYYQDIMGVSAWAMGVILLAARVFDAFNDPLMGVVVAKTKTRWGKFRPWLMIGTITNAVILYLMYSCPPSLSGGGLVAYAACTYILWGVTYTMMDIPYWSMIPAFTEGGKEREGLSAFARSAAGVGSALVTISTVLMVSFFGMKFSDKTPEYTGAVSRAETLKKAQTILMDEVRAVLPPEMADNVQTLEVRIRERDGFAKDLALENAKDISDLSTSRQASVRQKIIDLEARLSQINTDIRTFEEAFAQNGATEKQILAIEENALKILDVEQQVVKAKVPIERAGYRVWAIIVAAVFVLLIAVMCFTIKEKPTVDMKSPGVGDMFKALLQNDQAMTMVVAIVCINTALYITSNLVIYFFKYDFSPANWEGNYTLFNTLGGGFQILAMMFLFPLLRKFMNTTKIFYTSFVMAFVGYIILLFVSFSGTTNFWALVPSAFLIMSAIGMLNVIVTVFLANTVDYGELKNNRRDEAVIFSMQTFVVKLASGLSAMIAGLILSICNINKDAIVGTTLPPSSSTGLRMCVTLIPMVVLVVGVIVFKKNYILNDAKVLEITNEVKTRRSSADKNE